MCVHVAEHIAAEGSPGTGEVGTTPEAGQSLSSAAMTLLCLFLVIIEARAPFSHKVSLCNWLNGEGWRSRKLWF